MSDEDTAPDDPRLSGSGSGSGDGDAAGADAGGGGSEDGSTDDPSKRYWLTNDALAVFALVAYFGTVWAAGSGVLDASVLSGAAHAAMVTFAGAAVGWAFGTDIAERWGE